MKSCLWGLHSFRRSLWVQAFSIGCLGMVLKMEKIWRFIRFLRIFGVWPLSRCQFSAWFREKGFRFWLVCKLREKLARFQENAILRNDVNILESPIPRRNVKEFALALAPSKKVNSWKMSKQMWKGDFLDLIILMIPGYRSICRHWTFSKNQIMLFRACANLMPMCTSFASLFVPPTPWFNPDWPQCDRRDQNSTDTNTSLCWQWRPISPPL